MTSPRKSNDGPPPPLPGQVGAAKDPLVAVGDGDKLGADGLGVALTAAAVGTLLGVEPGAGSEVVTGVVVEVAVGVSGGFGASFGVGRGVGVGVGGGVGVGVGGGVGVGWGVGAEGMGSGGDVGAAVGLGWGGGSGFGGFGGFDAGSGVPVKSATKIEKSTVVALVPLPHETVAFPTMRDPQFRAMTGGAASVRETANQPASATARRTLVQVFRGRGSGKLVSRSSMERRRTAGRRQGP